MLKPSSPSASRTSIAVLTIASRVSGSRRRVCVRAGTRCQGAGGTGVVGSVAMSNTVPPLEQCLHFSRRRARTPFDNEHRSTGGDMSAAEISPQAAGVAFPRRWIAAIVMIGAAMMDLIDITVVNVALPTIRTGLGATGTQLQWVVSAYMLAFAAGLIISGSFGDLLGRKRIFIGGIAVFGVASLCAGLAHSPGELIAARVVQGAAAAAMIPQLLATFRVMFAGEERGKAFGMYGAILGFASAFGLLLGGLLVDADLFGWSWRAGFFINVPIAVVSLVALLGLVPETNDPEAGRPDLVGAGLLATAIVAIAYPLLEGRSLGWPTWIWGVLAAGIGGLVALGVIEERREHTRVAPLLRTRLLRIPAFSAGVAVQAAFSAAMQGFFLTFAVWLQTGMGFSPLGAGLTALAFSIGSFVLAPVAVPLAQRYGRLVLALGGVLM